MGLQYKVLALLLLLPLGCSGGGSLDRVAVHGEVTVAGVPVESGSITFVPVDGNTGPTAGGNIENGKYSIPAERGPVAGTNRIEIFGTRKTGRKIPHPDLPDVILDEIVEVVPAKYRTDSPLKRELESGKLDFDLEAE